jgi:hypothetical protein
MPGNNNHVVIGDQNKALMMTWYLTPLHDMSMSMSLACLERAFSQTSSAMETNIVTTAP